MDYNIKNAERAIQSWKVEDMKKRFKIAMPYFCLELERAERNSNRLSRFYPTTIE